MIEQGSVGTRLLPQLCLLLLRTLTMLALCLLVLMTLLQRSSNVSTLLEMSDLTSAITYPLKLAIDAALTPIAAANEGLTVTGCVPRKSCRRSCHS